MKKTVTTVLMSLLLAVSAIAGGVGENPQFAKTIDGQDIQVFLDAAPYSLVQAAAEACKERGDKYCPSWGGPNIPLTPGGSVTGADYAAVIRAQEDAYKAAKAKASETQAQADWEVVAGLALRSSVKASVYNRIARNLKNSALTQGTLKKTGVPEGIPGVAHIDREALKQAISWYTKAEELGKSGSVMQQENADKTAVNQELSREMAEQATGNIKWIESLLASDRYDADGNHIYRK